MLSQKPLTEHFHPADIQFSSIPSPFFIKFVPSFHFHILSTEIPNRIDKIYPIFSLTFKHSGEFSFKHHCLRSREEEGERYEDQYDSHGVLIKDQVVSKRDDADISQNCS